MHHPFSIASGAFVRRLADFLRYHALFSPAEQEAARLAYLRATGRQP